MNTNNLFKDFTGREEDLKKVTRWSIKPVMYYRSNLWIHSWRVHWIVKTLIPDMQKVFSTFDVEKALLIALVHDDAEIVMGDIQAGNKINMTKEQLDAVKKTEEEAIEKIAERFPKMLGAYVYKDLLKEAHLKNTFESQVMNFADKFDAFGEALHEIYGGNKLFSEPTKTEFGLAPVPAQFYITFFNKREEKMPLLSPLFATDTALIQIPEGHDWSVLAEKGSIHSKDFIGRNTGYWPYDMWKEILISNGGEEELQNMITQKEVL